MQLSNTPGKLVLPFSNAGAKNAIPVASQVGITPGAASLVDGFPPLTRTPIAAGGVPPSGLDMNGILFDLSAVVRWANAGGGYAYDASFATDPNVGGYPKGARVLMADGTGYWFNTVDNNTTNPDDPLTAAGWVPDMSGGMANVVMTNANVTLSPVQYGKKVLVISGTLVANLNLVFPSTVGSWYIINATTGPYVITAKTAAGAGVTINQAFRGSVFGDGTDIYTASQSDVISIKQFGAKSGSDITAALTLAASVLRNGQTLDLEGGTYFISYQGAAYSSVNGNVVMNFQGLSDIAIIGHGATIKVVNHDISAKGGLRFANFKGCKRVRVSGINFDMTFTGVNTSASYYPFCGAITALDDDGATPDFATLNSDFLIDNCTFKLFHQYGNWALSGNPYAGDPNNGYKLFSIFVSGPYTATEYNNQCRNIEVRSCTWLKGHNGYGVWLWSWNNCKVSKCVAEDWVTKYSDQNGVYQNGGVAMIRHIPFRTQGMVIEGNSFRAKPSAERTAGSGFEGCAEFYIHANNMGAVAWAKGLTVVANNTVILGVGAQSGSSLDEFVFFNGFGELVITGNTVDGHHSQNPTGYTGTYLMELTPGGFGGASNGECSILIDGNIFGPWVFGGIYFTNGTNVSADYRRCKSLVVTNNIHQSGDFFFRGAAYTPLTYEGVNEMLIANNVIQERNPGLFPPPSVNNYGIFIASNVATDVVICHDNIITGKTYNILTNSSYCSSSARVKRYNNKSDVSVLFLASNVFPFDQISDNPVLQAISNDASYQPYVKCTNTYSGTAELIMYQQSTSSYLLATNDLHVYTDGADQTVTDSNVFRPAADNTKSLGNGSFRWSTVYAGTGTINTSDERTKQQIGDIDARVLAAWGKVNFCQFKFNDAIEQKGDGARWHFGVIAQRVKEAFESEGLDAFEFGILCYDEWGDQYSEVVSEEVDEEGNPTGRHISTRVLVAPAGNRYGVRYEEALALECAYLRSKIQ